jgi:hypothetical protein
MSPASSEGIVPFRDNDQEVRRRAVSARDTINKWCGLKKPTAKPSHATRFEVTNHEANTVGSKHHELLL